MMASPALNQWMRHHRCPEMGHRLDTSSWECGHGVEGVSLLFPHPPHQNVRGERAQLSDNPLHPIFIEQGGEKGSFNGRSGGTNQAVTFCSHRSA